MTTFVFLLCSLGRILANANAWCRCPRFAFLVWTPTLGRVKIRAAATRRLLTVSRGRRRTLSRKLQDGHELLRGESEDLLDFDELLTLCNALRDADQRHPRPADNPDVAAFSRHALCGDVPSRR
jgi:hypothetical protein